MVIGEDVEFTITLNGDPVQARVVFESISTVRFSNQTTGIVNFTVPLAPQGDEEYIITASLLDMQTSHTILVKNRTMTLDIELAQDNNIEIDEFVVTIQFFNSPIFAFLNLIISCQTIKR